MAPVNNLTTLDVSNSPGLIWLMLNANNLTSLNLGSSINLANLGMQAQNNTGSLIIHVGTASRVAQAQAIWTVASGTISTGTTFTDAPY